MTKISLFIIATVILHLAIDHCQALDNTDSRENQSEIIPIKENTPFTYRSRYHPRKRRQNEEVALDTASTVLSILPLDRIGTIVGQIMAVGLKEMMNPDVGKKLVNVIENQAPLLLTSLFSNLYGTLRVPGRPSSNLTSSSIALNNNAVKQLSNSSTSELVNAIRRPARK